MFTIHCTSIDNGTRIDIQKTFPSVNLANKLKIPHVQRQEGVKDCGLFAIAFATYLACGGDPDVLLLDQFKQEELQCCLVSCLEQKKFVDFSSIINNY